MHSIYVGTRLIDLKSNYPSSCIPSRPRNIPSWNCVEDEVKERIRKLTRRKAIDKFPTLSDPCLSGNRI
jgi:hypothetical protein